MRILFALIVVIGNITWIMGQKTFEFTIEGMTCRGCVNTATHALQKINGVDSVLIDLESKSARVIADIHVTEADLKKIISDKTNFEALFAGETLPKPLTGKQREGLDIEIIKGGNKIKLKDHLA